MSFTYDLTTDIGQIRLEIGDTEEGQGVKPDGSNFSDEELQVILDREGGVMAAVAGVCEVLATQYARLVDTSVGPRREALGSIAQQYAARAAQLRKQYGGAGMAMMSAAVVRVDGYSDDIASDDVGAAASDYVWEGYSG